MNRSPPTRCPFRKFMHVRGMNHFFIQTVYDMIMYVHELYVCLKTFLISTESVVIKLIFLFYGIEYLVLILACFSVKRLFIYDMSRYNKFTFFRICEFLFLSEGSHSHCPNKFTASSWNELSNDNCPTLPIHYHFLGAVLCSSQCAYLD